MPRRSASTVELKKGNPLLMADPTLKRWHDMMAGGKGGEAAIEIIRSVGTGTTPKALFDPRLAAIRLAGLHGDGRTLQRAGPLHRPDRL